MKLVLIFHVTRQMLKILGRRKTFVMPAAQARLTRSAAPIENTIVAERTSRSRRPRSTKTLGAKTTTDTFEPKLVSMYSRHAPLICIENSGMHTTLNSGRERTFGLQLNSELVQGQARSANGVGSGWSSGSGASQAAAGISRVWRSVNKTHFGGFLKESIGNEYYNSNLCTFINWNLKNVFKFLYASNSNVVQSYNGSTNKRGLKKVCCWRAWFWLS